MVDALRDTDPVPAGPDVLLAAPSAPPPQPPKGSVGARLRQTLWASRFSLLFLAIGVGIALALVVVMGLAGLYDLNYVIRELPQGVGPAETSLEFATFTYLFGMVGALGLGLIRAYPPKKSLRLGQKLWRWPLYGFASGYVAAIRGTPFLVQMLITLNVFLLEAPQFAYLGWSVFYWAGFFALLINTTGYQAEAFRAGFQSVDAGQIEGAKAVGLGRFRIFFLITLPQGFRLVTLPLANEWISNFKTATVLSIIGVVELFYWTGRNVAVFDGKPIEAFVLLVFFYLIINVTLSRVVTYVEKVRRIPGLGTPTSEITLSKRMFSFGGNHDT
ncbi:MAG TPA: amino acid ABC transporter permease [Thermoplasmata archaeon]|nr:amino acid ABC transporter permease [Thermoplasmata archaeon]